jgi:hypothetical protein
MTYVETWDETNPAGSRARSLGDDDIREFKRCLRERLATDHEFAADESGDDNIGYHKKATFIDSVTDFALVTGCGVLYAKTEDGHLELFYRNADGINQLTVNGAIQNAISALSDVVLTNIADDQFLRYNTASGKWVNETIHVSVAGYAKYKA